MEPVKDALNELERKMDREEVKAPQKQEAAQLIYNDALRRAVSLRVETELQSLRLYNNQRSSLEVSGGSGKTTRDYVRVLFRHKAAIVTTFVALTLTVFVGLQMLTPEYRSSAKMLISGEKQVEGSYYQAIGGFKNAPIAMTQSEIVNSFPVIQRAAKALGYYNRPLDYEKQFASPIKARWIAFQTAITERKLARLSPEARKDFMTRRAEDMLRKATKVEPIRDTNLFMINVKDFSPEGAAMAANVMSRSYVIFDIEQQLAELQLKYGDKHLAVMELKDNIENISRDLTGSPVSNMEAIGPASVKIIEQAQPPLMPEGVAKKLIFLVALVGSLILGVILAFAFDGLDQTFKTPQEVESYLNLPYLGAVPKRSFTDRVLVKDAKRSTPYTQAYQNLSDQIYLLMKSKGSKFFHFTAACPGEGTTTIVANLGLYLAHRANLNVLLIDANLRRPSLNKTFNIPDHLGLADLLEGKVPFDKVVQNLGPNLTVLPAGRSIFNPVTLLDSPGMTELIKVASERFDVILADSSNMNQHKDANILSSYFDGTILVVDESRTRRQVVKNAIAPLEEKNVNLLGVVLNNRTYAIPKVIYENV